MPYWHFIFVKSLLQTISYSRNAKDGSPSRAVFILKKPLSDAEQKRVVKIVLLRDLEQLAL